MKLHGTMKNVDESLSIGGIRCEELAQQYKTPLYIVDEELVRTNCKKYIEGMTKSSQKNKVAYAGKAFLPMYMCNIVNEEGLCLDVVSGGELYTAYKSGFPMERVLFHGNSKTREEMNQGLDLGVGVFVVDNYYELELLNKFAHEKNIIQNVYLRITPGIEAHTHEYIQTSTDVQ